ERIERDLLHRRLAFLQAEDIRRLLLHEPRYKRLAQADGVDVPGGDGEGHGRFLSDAGATISARAVLAKSGRHGLPRLRARARCTEDAEWRPHAPDPPRRAACHPASSPA